MSFAGVPWLVEPGHTREIILDDERALLYYLDGRIRFRHVCRRPKIEVMAAPALAYGPAGADEHGKRHIVTETEKGVTVRASILCPDCGTHGFVTNSTWSGTGPRRPRVSPRVRQ